MKGKNKKIIKGLGVGALACVGMVGLTGCANISNTDYDRIMNSVETVENSVSDLEAATVYNNAMNKIINTSSDFWNNMKVESTMRYSDEGEDFVDYIESYFIKNEEQQILFSKDVGEIDSFENNSYNSIYTDDDKVIFIDKENDGCHKSEDTTSFVEECLDSGIILNFFVGIDDGNGFKFYDSSDIVSATKNEQGNYMITIIYRYVYTEFGHTGIYSFVIHNEIDSEFNLISQIINAESIDREYSMKYTQTNKYYYGNVEYSDIQEEFEQLINYEESTPEV